MKLLIVLLVWSQGVYSSNANASATASSSAAAADVKGEKERKAFHGTAPMRSQEVGEAIGNQRTQISDLIAEYAHDYPEMPNNVASAIVNLTGVAKPGEPKLVYEWLEAAPQNVNAIHAYTNGKYETSLLLLVIEAYAGGRYYEGANEAPTQLLQKVLSLNPDVRYRAQVSRSQACTALEAICTMFSTNEDMHMSFVKKIIDLLIVQGAYPTAIEAELNKLLAAREYEVRHITRSNAPYKYERDITAAALDYLHDLQAAPILAEEMTEHRGFPPELAEMSAQYLAPAYKTPKKHHHRKSKSNGK